MRLPISSWTVFIIMTGGLILLLVGQRPQLQTEDGGGPGQVVQIVGHGITWGAAAVLTVRMIRGIRSAEANAAEQKAPPSHEPPKV